MRHRVAVVLVGKVGVVMTGWPTGRDGRHSATAAAQENVQGDGRGLHGP